MTNSSSIGFSLATKTQLQRRNADAHLTQNPLQFSEYPQQFLELMVSVDFTAGNSEKHPPLELLSPTPIPHLVQSHSHSAAAFLSLVRCWGLLQVLWREEALPHPRGACRTVEGAAHALVTLCGPAGNGIAAAPPEACSGRRLAVVRSALPPFWHCCHH